jgi:hypothetical protein
VITAKENVYSGMMLSASFLLFWDNNSMFIQVSKRESLWKDWTHNDLIFYEIPSLKLEQRR